MEHKHHTIQIGEDGVARVKIVGDGDTEIALQFVKDAEQIFNEHKGGPYSAIVDMSESGFSNLGGIDIYRDFIKTDKLDKIAFVGANVAVKSLIELATIDRKRPVDFFSKEEDALKWINS